MGGNKKKRMGRWLVFCLCLVAAGIFLFWAYGRPQPSKTVFPHRPGAHQGASIGFSSPQLAQDLAVAELRQTIAQKESALATAHAELRQEPVLERKEMLLEQIKRNERVLDALKKRLREERRQRHVPGPKVNSGARAKQQIEDAQAILKAVFPEQEIPIKNGAAALRVAKRRERKESLRWLEGQPVAFFGEGIHTGPIGSLDVGDDWLLYIRFKPTLDFRPSSVSWAACVVGVLRTIDVDKKVISIEAKPKDWKLVDES